MNNKEILQQAQAINTPALNKLLEKYRENRQLKIPTKKLISIIQAEIELIINTKLWD